MLLQDRLRSAQDRNDTDLQAQTLFYMAQCSIGRGRVDEAISRIERAMQLRFHWYRGPERHYAEAAKRALVGDRDGALRMLARAVDEGHAEADWLSRDAAFDALRGDPEFEAIASRMRDLAF